MITIMKMRMKDGRRPPRRFAPNPTISKTKRIFTSGCNRNLQSSMRVFSRCKTHPSTWHAAYMRQPLGNANTTQTDSHECWRLFTFLQVFTLLPPSAHQASSLQLVQCQWVGWDTPAGTWPSSAGNVKHSRRDETWTATRLRGTEESDYTPHS